MSRFYLKNTASDLSVLTGIDEIKAASGTLGSSTGRSCLILGGSTQLTSLVAWTSGEYPTNNGTWPNDGWGYSLDVTANGADTSHTVRISRVNDSGNTLRYLNASLGQYAFFSTTGFAGTGIKTSTARDFTSLYDFNFSGTDATDRAVVTLSSTNTSMHSDETITYNVEDADSWIESTNFKFYINCNALTTTSTLYSPAVVTVADPITDAFYFTNTNISIPGTFDYEKEMSTTATPSNNHSNLHQSTISINTYVASYMTNELFTANADWPTTGWYVALEVYTSSASATLSSTIKRTDDPVTGYANTQAVTTADTLTAGYNVKVYGPFDWTGVNSWVGRSSGDSIAIEVRFNVSGSTNVGVAWDSYNSYVYNASLVSSTPTIGCNAITASSTLYNPTVNVGAVTVACNVLTATSTLYNSTITTYNLVECNAISAPESLFNPSATVGSVSSVANLITTSSILYSPSLFYTVAMNVLNTSSSILNSVVVPPVVTISCQSYSASSSVLNPSITVGAVSISMQSLSTSSTMYDTSLILNLDLPVLVASTSVLSPTVNSNIYLNSIATSTNIISPALVYWLGLQALDTASTVYAPTLKQDISLDVYTSSSSILNSDVSATGSIQNLDFDLLDTVTTLYAPTTFSTITLQTVSTSSIVRAPALKYNVVLPIIATSSSLFTPAMVYLIELQAILTAPTVNAPFVGEPPPDTFSGAIVKTHNPSPFPIGL